MAEQLLTVGGGVFFLNMIRVGLYIMLVISHPVFSQGVSSVLDKSTNPGEVLVEFDNRTTEVKGHTQLLDEWHRGSIYLKSGSYIEKLALNFDLESDFVEVKVDSIVKVIPLHLTDQFVLENEDGDPRTFCSCSNYYLDDEVPLAGLCEVVDSSYYGLIIRHGMHIKPATYVPALDMGKREEEIIKTQDYLLTIESNALPVTRRRSVLIEFYGKHGEELEEFLDNNRLNLKKEKDLDRLLHFLNSLQ